MLDSIFSTSFAKQYKKNEGVISLICKQEACKRSTWTWGEAACRRAPEGKGKKEVMDEESWKRTAQLKKIETEDRKRRRQEERGE